MAIKISETATYFAGLITLPSTFSVEAWVKTTQTGTGRVASVDGVVGGRLFQFGIVSGKFWVTVVGSDSTVYTGSSSATVNDGQWHHLVLSVQSGTHRRAQDSVLTTDTIDSTDSRQVQDFISLADYADSDGDSPVVPSDISESTVLMYVDGVLDTTFKVSGGVTGVTQSIRLFDSGFSDYDFNGSAGEIALYDGEALSSDRILAHYQSISSGYSREVLADSPFRYWRLDQSSGDAIDSSGNSETLTLFGSGLVFSEPLASYLTASDQVTLSDSITAESSLFSYFGEDISVDDKASWTVGVGLPVSDSINFLEELTAEFYPFVDVIVTDDYTTEIVQAEEPPKPDRVDYRYITVDLLTNEFLAEIPFGSVKWGRAVRRAGEFSGEIPVVKENAHLNIYENTMPGRTALYIMRNGKCVWGGIIWSRSYEPEKRVLSVSGLEFISYFYHRYVWKTLTDVFRTMSPIAISSVEMTNGEAVFKVPGSSVSEILNVGDMVQISRIYDITQELEGEFVVTAVGPDYFIVDAGEDAADVPLTVATYANFIKITDNFEMVQELVNLTGSDFAGIALSRYEPAKPGLERSPTLSIVQSERSDGYAILATDRAHGLLKGQEIEVKDVGTPQTGRTFDGVHTITSIPSEYAFEFVSLGADQEPTTESGLKILDLATFSIVSGRDDDGALHGDVTITTKAPHGASPGDEVVINIGNASGKFSMQNEVGIVDTVPDNYTLTFWRSGSSDSGWYTPADVTTAGIAYNPALKTWTATVKTEYPHGFSTGSKVRVTGLGLPYEDVHTPVTKVDELTIQFPVSRESSVRSTETRGAGVVFFTTKEAHGALAGDTIQIANWGTYTTPGQYSGVNYTVKSVINPYTLAVVKVLRSKVARAKTTKDSKILTVSSKVGIEIGTTILCANVPSGTTVRSISPTQNEITMSAKATASIVNKVTDATVLSGRTEIPIKVSTSGVQVGMYVYAQGNSHIPSGTTITSVNGTTKKITLSNATTGSIPANTTLIIEARASFQKYEDPGTINNNVPAAAKLRVISDIPYEAIKISRGEVYVETDRVSIRNGGQVLLGSRAYAGTYGGYANNSEIDIEVVEESETGGTPGTSDLSIIVSSDLKTVGEIIEAAASTISGFEYRIDCDYDEEIGQFTRKMVLSGYDVPDRLQPGEARTLESLGADKYVFEWPGNIKSFSLDESAEESATRMWVVGADPAVSGDYLPQPMSAAVDRDYLKDGWPILEASEKVDNQSDYSILYSYAHAYLKESLPPIDDLKITVNGTMLPEIGTYQPGDWCSLVFDDVFMNMRLQSKQEVRDNVMVRKIIGYSVTVPDNFGMPEEVELELIRDTTVDHVYKDESYEEGGISVSDYFNEQNPNENTNPTPDPDPQPLPDTWTTSTFILPRETRVAYGGGRWVVVSVKSNDIYGSYSSANGLDWTAGHYPPEGQSQYNTFTLAYGNDVFVSLPYGATGTSHNYASYTSNNGLTWRVHNNVLPTSALGNARVLSFGDSKFVAIDDDSTSVEGDIYCTYISPDGSSWSRHSITVPGLKTKISGAPDKSVNWRGIKYGGGRWLAFGEQTSNFSGDTEVILLASTNAINWTKITNPLGTSPYEIVPTGIAYGNGKWLFVGQLNGVPDSVRIYSSPDGLSWSQVTTSGDLPSDSYDLIFADGLFILVPGSGGSAIGVSEDGIHWTLINIPYSEQGQEGFNIVYGEETVVIIPVGILNPHSISGPWPPKALPPTDLALSSGSSSIFASWTSGEELAIDYIVQYKVSSSPTWLTLSTDGVSTSTSATIAGLTPEVSYDVRVATVTTYSTSEYSEVQTITVVSGAGGGGGGGEGGGKDTVGRDSPFLVVKKINNLLEFPGNSADYSITGMAVGSDNLIRVIVTPNLVNGSVPDSNWCGLATVDATNETLVSLVVGGESAFIGDPGSFYVSSIAPYLTASGNVSGIAAVNAPSGNFNDASDGFAKFQASDSYYPSFNTSASPITYGLFSAYNKSNVFWQSLDNTNHLNIWKMNISTGTGGLAVSGPSGQGLYYLTCISPDEQKYYGYTNPNYNGGQSRLISVDATTGAITTIAGGQTGYKDSSLLQSQFDFYRSPRMAINKAGTKIAIAEQAQNGSYAAVRIVDLTRNKVTTAHYETETELLGQFLYDGGNFLFSHFGPFGPDSIVWHPNSDRILYFASSVHIMKLDISPTGQWVVPAPPSNLKATTASSTSIRITWTKPAGSINDYVIQYAEAGTSNWIRYPDSISDVNSVTVTDLIAETPYDIRVASVNSYGMGPFSAPVSHTITSTKPGGSGYDTRPQMNFQRLPMIGGSGIAADGTGKLIAPTGASNYYYSTDNGSTWSTGTLPPAQAYSHVTYGGGKWVIQQNNSTIGNSVPSTYLKSTDQTSWSSVPLPSAGEWTMFQFVNGKFFTSLLSENKLAYSTDLSSWTVVTMPLVEPFSPAWKIAYGNNIWVAVSHNQGIAYSTDLTTWTMTSVAPEMAFSSSDQRVLCPILIEFGAGKFVAICTAGKNFGQDLYLTSTNGINWTPRAMPDSGTASFWNSMIYAGGQFVVSDAFGSSFAERDNAGLMMTSADGITWGIFSRDIAPANYTGHHGDVAYSQGKYIYATDNIGLNFWWE